MEAEVGLTRLTSQGLPGSPRTGFSLRASGRNPAGALILDLWPPELVSAAQFVVLCGGSHRKLTQMGSGWAV